MIHPQRRPALVTAVLTLACAHATHAQDRPDTLALAPVVVTATRVAGGETSATTSATVIAGDLLRERGIASVGEALKGVPGVTIAQSGSVGGTTSLFLRGGENDYVQVLVDGVPINEPGGYVDLASLTTENIDRIEVVRGPASVLYGSEAVTGVIQIFTRTGRGAPRATASVRAGSYRTLDADATLLGTLGAGGWSLSGARYGTDGILDFNNDYRNEVVSARIQLADAQRGDARLSLRYTNGTFHFPTDAGGVPFDSNQFSFERRVAVGAEVGRPLTERLEARLFIASSDLDAGTVDEPDNASTPFRSRSGRDSYRRSGEARLLFRLTPVTVLSAGAQLEWEREGTRFRSEDLSTSPSSSFESNDEGRRWNRAYYAQAVGTARSRLSYTAGLRLEDDENFGRYTTYRLGTSLRVARASRLRAAMGKGFKRPLFYEITGGGFAAPNPGLQPERSTAWEVGVEQALAGQRVEVGATYFDQRFRDLIQYTPPPGPGGTARYENLAAVRASGAEVEARLRPASVMRLDLSYTYLDTEVEDAGADAAGATYARGERLLRRPTHVASAAMSWRLLPPLALHAGIVIVGDRDDRRFAGFSSSRVELPSYTKLDVAADYTIRRSGRRSPEVTLAARLDNALDRRYESIAGFRSPGRLATVGARIGVDF